VLRSALKENGRSETIALENGTADNWSQLILAHPDGSEIAAIERNPVVPGGLGAQEIEEFLNQVEQSQPKSASRWLKAYLPRVRCIYAFQILNGARIGDGWGALEVVRKSIKSVAGGIIQGDGEGFSNEDGYHILWQLSDSAKGIWWMAVLKDGQWVTFQMDLGNREHRAAFQRGEIPAGIKAARVGE